MMIFVPNKMLELVISIGLSIVELASHHHMKVITVQQNVEEKSATWAKAFSFNVQKNKYS